MGKGCFFFFRFIMEPPGSLDENTGKYEKILVRTSELFYEKRNHIFFLFLFICHFNL